MLCVAGAGAQAVGRGARPCLGQYVWWVRASDVYSVQVTASTPGSWWKRLLGSVFSALGDYPDHSVSQLVISERATGTVIAVLEGDGSSAADIVGDLAELSAESFSHRWLPASL